MNSNENLIENCLSLERIIKIFSEKKNSSSAYIEELQKKSEKIKDLSVKLDEMYKNEVKLLKMVDNLKSQGVDFEKAFEEARSSQSPDKKMKRGIPILKIGSLMQDTE